MDRKSNSRVDNLLFYLKQSENRLVHDNVISYTSENHDIHANVIMSYTFVNHVKNRFVWKWSRVRKGFLIKVDPDWIKCLGLEDRERHSLSVQSTETVMNIPAPDLSADTFQIQPNLSGKRMCTYQNRVIYMPKSYTYTYTC